VKLSKKVKGCLELAFGVFSMSMFVACMIICADSMFEEVLWAKVLFGVMGTWQFCGAVTGLAIGLVNLIDC